MRSVSVVCFDEEEAAIAARQRVFPKNISEVLDYNRPISLFCRILLLIVDIMKSVEN